MDYHQIEDAAKLRALVDSIVILEADAELSSLLRELVHQATTLVGARYGALGIIALGGDRLSEFITVGLDEEERTAIGAFPVGKGLLGRLISDAAPLRVGDLASHPDRAGFPANHPSMTSFLGVPVRLGAGMVFGNLYLCEKHDGTAFTDSDEALAVTIGRVAGLLIEKAQLRLRLTELTLATERERMARDLHDTVIQRLFAVGLMLQGATKTEIPTEVRQTLSGAVDELDETIREIRSTIFAVTRGGGDDSTLRRGLLVLCDQVSSRLGVPVTASFHGPVDTAVGPRAAEQALLIAREALSNVVRHASASNAHVDVTASATGLSVCVIDDGIGIDPSAPRNGRGLSNLSIRAKELGGWCTLEPREEGGTLVEWHITKLSDEPR